MIGWENNQGAYFIQKLNDELDSVESDVSDVTTTASTNATNIGKMSDLTTTAKDTLVKAVNEVDSNADTNASAIGTLSELTTSAKTNLVSAINELNIIKNHGYITGVAGGTAHMDLTLSKGYRGIIITVGALSNRMGIWIVASTSSGGLNNSIVKAGDQVSLSGTQDVISVNYSATQNSTDVYSIDLTGTATVVTQ